MVLKWCKPISVNNYDKTFHVKISEQFILGHWKNKKIFLFKNFLGFYYLAIYINSCYLFTNEGILRFFYLRQAKYKNNKHTVSHIGLYFKILKNLFFDLSFLFKRKIRLNGVGFRAFRESRFLRLSIGFSYVVTVNIPVTIDVVVTDEKKQNFTVYGLNRQAVNHFVRVIRNIHPPDVYTGQGIIFFEEYKKLKLKPGKKQAQNY